MAGFNAEDFAALEKEKETLPIRRRKSARRRSEQTVAGGRSIEGCARYSIGMLWIYRWWHWAGKGWRMRNADGVLALESNRVVSVFTIRNKC